MIPEPVLQIRDGNRPPGVHKIASSPVARKGVRCSFDASVNYGRLSFRRAEVIAVFQQPIDRLDPEDPIGGDLARNG